MSIQSIQTYLETNYRQFQESVLSIARSSNPSSRILQTDVQMYNFDKISRCIHPEKRGFSSADALRFYCNAIELIEFKTGFKRTITKKNWNREKASCSYKGDVCDDYWDVFWRLEKRERKILIDSIKNKAVESYITLEKHILTQLVDVDPVPIKYIAVIDSDDVEGIVDTLIDLSGEKPNEDNSSEQVKRSLSKLRGCRDSKMQPYYYDEIQVYTFQEFEARLKHER